MKFMKSQMNLLLSFCLLLSISMATYSQNVSVSPSRIYFKTGIGEFETQSITVTNNSDNSQTFQVSFADFEANGNQGKSEILAPGESEHSCSEWLSASPAYFKLGPGEDKKVNVLLQVPNLPSAAKVKWAVMSIKLAKERTAPSDNNDKTVGFGIVQTFQFIVHIFQTPPTVTFKNAEITSFKEVNTEDETARILAIEVSNTGDAILDCASYLELTNLQDGSSQRLDIKAFTILPGGQREVHFELPKDLTVGQYSVLGVVDYGSKEKVEAAELDITVP